MIIYMKSTKACKGKMIKSEVKMKGSKDNKEQKTKAKMNKPNLNFLWLKIPWIKNGPFSKWKRSSFRKKLTDINNAAIIFKAKIEKFDKIIQRYPPIFKTLSQNTSKNANKLTFSRKRITITPKRSKNCWFKIRKRMSLLVIIMNGFLKNLTWKIRWLF